MKVILQHDIEGLGEEGDVKEVAPGYGRNFLFRKQLAVLFSDANVSALEQRRLQIESHKSEKRQEALSLKERLQGQALTFKMAAGENGKLFGAITNANIATALHELGFELDRRRIELPEHSLKSLGTHTVTARLYGGEDADLSVTIVAQEE